MPLIFPYSAQILLENALFCRQKARPAKNSLFCSKLCRQNLSKPTFYYFSINNRSNVFAKKSKLKSFPECHFFENTRTNFTLNLVLVLVLVLNLKLSNVVVAKKRFYHFWVAYFLTRKNEIKSNLLLVFVLVLVSTSRRDLPLLQLSWLFHSCQTPSHPGELNSESYNCDLQV